MMMKMKEGTRDSVWNVPSHISWFWNLRSYQSWQDGKKMLKSWIVLRRIQKKIGPFFTERNWQIRDEQVNLAANMGDASRAG